MNPALHRRRFCWMALSGAAVGLATDNARAGGRLEARLEHWRRHAESIHSLHAHVRTTRTSALLRAPLEQQGELLFVAPSQLTLTTADALTVVEGEDVRLRARFAEAHGSRSWTEDTDEARRWLAQHLVAMFGGDPEQLRRDARVTAPSDRRHRIDLLPHRESGIRRTLRSVSMTLDPASGALVEIAIEEARGDRCVLALHDVRQNLDDEALALMRERMHAA